MLQHSCTHSSLAAAYIGDPIRSYTATSIAHVKGIPNRVPEPHFKLSEAQRRAVSPRYDVDALGVLLAHLTPEERPKLLAAASDLSVGEMAMAFPELRDELQPPVSPSGRR